MVFVAFNKVSFAAKTGDYDINWIDCDDEDEFRKQAGQYA
jgi:hypothetical protein